MKKVFLASVGVAATLMGYSTAEAASGYVGVGVIRQNVDAGTSDITSDGYGISGAAAFDLQNGWGTQFGASYTDSDDGDGALGADAHIFSRNEDRLYGAFLAVSDSDSTTMWSVGGELNGYMENTTFAGAVAYNDFGDIDASGISATGELRFFVHDNLRLDVGAGWFNLNPDAGVDTDGFAFGVGGEWQIPSAPVSVFAGFNQAHLNDVTAPAPDTISSTSLGVRYNFGGTLKDRDRTGASQGSGMASGLTKLF